MKYCPKCKIRAPAEAMACPKCQGALRTVGEPGAAPLADDATLTMQLMGLQHEVVRSRRNARLLGMISMLLVLVLVAVWIAIHVHDILQFAELAEIEVRPAKSPGEVAINFLRKSSGKVEFVRTGSERTETLVDHGRVPSDSTTHAPVEFAWGGAAAGEFTIRATYRSGLWLAEQQWDVRNGEVRSTK